MLSIYFLANLRRETMDPAFVGGLMPWGWLCAPDNATAAGRAFAAAANRMGREVLADNGNYAGIGRLAGRFSARGRSVRRAVAGVEERLGRCAVRADLPGPPAARIDSLVQDVVAAAPAAALSAADAAAGQAGLSPTRTIGAEDVVPAPALWGATANYPVASALDYRRRWTPAGSSPAPACGGPRWASAGSWPTTTPPCGCPSRCPAATSGPRRWPAGSPTASERSPEAFRFLGLGSPVMMAVAAAALAGTPLLTFDATSPIKDAAQGSLYTTSPGYLKLRTRAVALAIAEGRSRWDCPCPGCGPFLRQHPIRERAARRWRAGHPAADVAAALREGGALYSALPLLCEPRPGPLRTKVNTARMTHNHWVLSQACADLRGGARTPADQIDRAEGVVAGYRAATRNAWFARSVRMSFEIAVGRGP